MACYSPLRGYRDVTSGAWVSKQSSTAYEEMTVPCGGCIGCRTTRAKHWAARITHEASKWPTNAFITLTYRDRSQCNAKQLDKGWHLPVSGSLDKKHLQGFLKRLRHHLGNRKIKYYGCGEYGEENDRPHYHLCLFNCPFGDKELYSHNNGYPLFTSQFLEDIWRYGFVTIGQLTYETAAYTARYTLKKVTGSMAQDHYLRFDEYGVAYWLEPEYNVMSLGRRCKLHRGAALPPEDCDKCTGAIGADWIRDYMDDVYPSDETPVPGKGDIKGTPRYYDKVLERTDPELYEEIKAKRASYAKKNKSEFSPQRLEDKYKCHMALTKHLQRKL